MREVETNDLNCPLFIHSIPFIQVRGWHGRWQGNRHDVSARGAARRSARTPAVVGAVDTVDADLLQVITL
jgi:hypothetical protein